jgi:hypothetical protein
MLQYEEAYEAIPCLADFGNGTVTTRTLLDRPVLARYLVPWGRFS